MGENMLVGIYKKLLIFLSLLSIENIFADSYFIGRDPTWYPTSLYGKADFINGFLDALLQKISAQKNISLYISNTDPTRLFYFLNEDTFQGVLSTRNINSESVQKFEFSEPIILLGPVLVTPIDSPYKNIEDFSNRIIGLNPSNDSVLIAQKNPSVIIHYYENLIKALEDLQRGNIDGALIPYILAHSLIPHRFSKITIVTPPLNLEGIRLLTLKDQNKELIRLFDLEFTEMQKNGQLDQLKLEFKIP
jgi:polar amino acid transport system substrate-binding protein